MNSLWFADYNKEYHSDDAAFFSGKDVPIIDELQQNFVALQEEFKILWEENNGKVENYFGDYSAYDDKQFPPNSWSKLPIQVWGFKNKKLAKRFPVLADFTKRHSAITTCCVTKLAPKSIIKMHYGETNAIYRIHLGLNVPTNDPSICGIEVMNEVRAWNNGESFGFIDSNPHWVWNKSDQDRYIVIIDLLRKPFIKYKWFISIRIVISILFFSVFTRILNEKTLKLVPVWFLNMLAIILFVPIFLSIKINNQLGIIKI